MSNNSQNEVVLPSLADFKLLYSTWMGERNFPDLQMLFLNKELEGTLKQAENRFMNLALSLKKSDPNLSDLQIEDLALRQMMAEELLEGEEEVALLPEMPASARSSQPSNLPQAKAKSPSAKSPSNPSLEKILAFVNRLD
jgi:hypothetical protein